MKKQTLILVVIGVVLFIAGGTLAFATVENGSKTKSPVTIAATSTPVVVATANIPAGTTGQAMQAQGLVAIQAVSAKKYVGTDLTSLAALTNVVTTAAVTKGNALQSTELTTSLNAVSLPKGLDGETITLSGVDALAGYLQPGSHVDVYAFVSKFSTGGTTGVRNPEQPCTELAMANIEVLDVQSTSPSFVGHQSTSGRSIPTSETVLLAVSPAQSRELSFFTQNETIQLVQTQKDTLPPIVGQCIGTNELVGS